MCEPEPPVSILKGGLVTASLTRQACSSLKLVTIHRQVPGPGQGAALSGPATKDRGREVMLQRPRHPGHPWSKAREAPGFTHGLGGPEVRGPWRRQCRPLATSLPLRRRLCTEHQSTASGPEEQDAASTEGGCLHAATARGRGALGRAESRLRPWCVEGRLSRSKTGERRRGSQSARRGLSLSAAAGNQPPVCATEPKKA